MPANGATFISPGSILLEASASSPDSTIANVTYYDGASKIAAATATPYKITWKTATAGSHTLTAVAKDKLGLTTTSAAVTITVNPDQPPAVALTGPVSGFTTIGPTTLLLTATASSSDSTVVGVDFYNGASKVGTSKSAPYQYSWKNVQAGSYTLKAVATDALGVQASSTPVTITVTQDVAPNVSITAPANGATSVLGLPIQLSATASSPDEAITSVTYYYVNSPANTKIGTVKAPFNYTWKNVALGNYSLIAVATDTLGVQTTSSPVALTVVPDHPPVVSLITPLSGATYVAPGSVELLASASSPDVTISSVTFYNGTSKIATVSKAPFAYNWKNLAAGSYSVTATATDSVGTSTTSSAATFSVTSVTTSSVKITAPTNNKVLAAPATVTLTATASAPAGVARVGFYADSTLIGTATASPYQYNWQTIPAGVYRLTAVETDSQGASITSAPVTFTSDAPPVVTVSTPGGQSIFAAPAVINLMASVVDSGKISKVEFMAGSTLIGTATTAPYQYAWTSVPAGNYSVTAVAFDSLGITGTSPADQLQVLSDTGPVVALQTPSNALTFGTASDVSLSYAVTDAAASVSSVRIYRNGNLVTTLTSPTSGTTWTFTEQNPLPAGSYSYYAWAFDAAGVSTQSMPATVLVVPSLPYSTDFEEGEGANYYSVGSLAGQGAWNVTQGTVNVVSNVSYSGNQAMQLAAGSPAAIVQQAFAQSPNETIVFCDFYAEPTAEATVTASSVFTAEQAQFAFLQSSGQGVLEVFQGNGSGSGTWVPTGFTIPLNSSSQAQTWVRLTARLDFTRQKWDMYANGSLVAYDIPFISNTSTYFSTFQIQGDVSTDTFLDLLDVTTVNPLFADTANDGISDAWKEAYGLSITTNDRELNLSGDGIPVIEDYENGTSPFINTAVIPDPVQSGLLLHLRADAAVVTGPNGAVSEWLDQSPNGNVASQYQTGQQPTLVANQIHGLPSLAFNGSNTLTLPYNMMQNATAGEIIAVVDVGNNSTQLGMLWNFGTGYGSGYYNNQHFDDFGTSDTTEVLENPSEIAQYYIYDTSITSAGTSTYSYNGVPEWTRTGLAVGFQPYPDIGGYGNGSFTGNIAEVMVYNRVLSDAERTTVNTYLLTKYAFPTITVPVAPTDLKATPLSSDSVDLYWTAQNALMHTVTTIQRATGSGSFVQVAQVKDAASYTDTGLTPGTTYSYRLTIQSYAGTSANSNTATVTLPSGLSDITTQGMVLWLRSTAGTRGAGSLATWNDQSGLGNNAVPLDPTQLPQVVENQQNGLPAVQFNGELPLSLPPTVLLNAPAGQIFAVVRVQSVSGQYESLWQFGTGYGTTYNDGGHFDDFGSSDTTSVREPESETSVYFLYDTSIDSSGNSIFRYDGTAEWLRYGLTVGWGPFPLLGGGLGNLNGDIAEVVVYNRVLSSQEQNTVYAYFAAKYGLASLTANLNAPVITSSSSATGSTGVAFNYQVVATNSPSSYSATGLPPGLSINTATGAIMGSPISDGTSSATVTATNAYGTSSLNLTITINPGLPVITSVLAATGQVGVTFTYQIVATEGASSFAASGLPPGLSVTDPIAGVISGSPTNVGTYSVLLSATNAAGSGTANLALTINPPPPSLTSPASAPGKVGQSFSYQTTTSGTTTSYAASGLPPGLAISAGTGLITGSPTLAGTYAVTVTFTYAGGTSTATITLTIAPDFVVTSGLFLWLRSDTGLVTNSNGNVSQWTDQSGLGNNAFQSNAANQPLLVSNQANGLPVVRFNGSSELILPTNLMQNAPSGQIIAVVKVLNNPDTFSMLWNFGTGYGTSFYNLNHYDDFGSSDTSSVVVETQTQLAQYFVYDSSIDTDGTFIYRNDGTALWTRIEPSSALGFQTYPDIGGYGGGNFLGDIAEIIVFDRVLTPTEQGAVYGYLASRYALPAIATNVGAPAITSTSVATGIQGQVFNYQITASNSPTGFNATGLPPGLSVNTGTGAITGSPTSVGQTIAVISASNSSGSGSTPLTITVNSAPPAITSAASASGQVGQYFSFQVVATNSPTSFTASDLPPGLSIDPVAGAISGTPTTAGMFTVNLSATNEGGTGTSTFTITITAAVSLTSATSTVGIIDTLFTYAVMTNGTGSETFSASGLPPGLSIDSSGVISGTPTAIGSYTVNLTISGSFGTITPQITITIGSGVPVTSGLVLALQGDMSLQTETINGTPTAVWSDLSGAGNNAIQTLTYNGAIEAPATVPNSLNGHGVMHFDHTQAQFLVLPGFLNDATQGEMFVVVREPSANIAPYGSGSLPGAWQFGGNGTFFSDFVGAVDDFMSENQNQALAPVSFTTFNIYNVSASASQWTNRLNGKVLLAAGTNQFERSGGGSYVLPGGRITDEAGPVIGLASYLSLDEGDTFFQGTPFDGDIAEMIVFDRVLSDSERLQVGQYLEGKYALPNIGTPTTSPNNLQASAISPSSIYLTWTGSAANFGISYVIQRQSGSGPFMTVGQVDDTYSYVDSNLATNTPYTYRVVAESYAGSSAPSATASATTLVTSNGIPNSGLVLWLKADAGVVKDSSSVVYWGDQSGKAHDATASSSASAPSLMANAINGLPAVHFVSMNSQSLAFPSILANQQAGDVLVVIRATASGSSGAYALGYVGADFNAVYNSISDGFMGDTQFSVTIPAPTQLTSFNLYEATASPGEWISWINGTYLSGGPGDTRRLATTPENAVEDETAGTIGYADGKHFDGDIAEIIVYDRNLTDAERLQIGQYLQNRYNLGNVVVPQAPSNLAANVDIFGNVEVTWSPSAGAAGYSVMRSIDGGSWKSVAYVGADGPSGLFVDATVLSGSTVAYEIQAVGLSGESAVSASASSPAPYAIDPTTGLPYWFNGLDGTSPLPSPPSQPTPPPGPPGTTPLTITLTAPPNATLQ